MIFRETKLSGAYVIEPERISDERGFFARTWSQKEFSDEGLISDLLECNVSFNRKRGTLRGMHYQRAPNAQAKLVRCTMGAAYDVAIDLRPDSPTFKQWVAVQLSGENHLMFYIPEGFAHGFQTLEDDTEIFYQMSRGYAPESAQGVRWNDPAFGITWPSALERTIIERDHEYSDFVG